MSGAEPWNNDFNLTERLTLLDYHNSTQSKTETKVYILNAIDPFQVNALTIQIKGKSNRLSANNNKLFPVVHENQNRL